MPAGRHAGHVSKPFKQAVLLAALENVMVARNDKEPIALPLAAAQAGEGPSYRSLTAVRSKTLPISVSG